MSEQDGREGTVLTRIPADTFAHRLMLARSHAGQLTIQEAATKCGLIPQSWSNWERGRVPRDLLDLAEAISEGLGVDHDWLLMGGPLAKPERKVRPNKVSLFARRPVGRAGTAPRADRRPRRLRYDRVPA